MAVQNPTNRVTKEQLQTWLGQMFDDYGIQRPNVEITIMGTSNLGDGLLSDVTFIELYVNDTDPNNPNQSKKKRKRRRRPKPKSPYKGLPRRMAVKNYKIGPAMREMVPFAAMGKNERDFYTKIYPLLKGTQQHFHVPENRMFKHVPELYYFNLNIPDREVFAFENLHELGYRMHNRKEPMDLAHMEVVLDLYARLHAVAFGLKDHNELAFWLFSNELGNVMVDVSLEEILQERTYFANLRNMAANINAGDLTNAFDLLSTMMHATDPCPPECVFIHGDCENNNYFFKYAEDGTIEDVRLLDWQFCRMAPPLYDVSYFIFANLDPNNLRHFDHLKDHYYDRLSSYMRYYDLDSRSVFSREAYENQWRQYARFGVRMMFSVVKNLLAEDNEINDLETIAQNRANRVPGEVFDIEMPEIPTACVYGNELLQRCRQRTFPILRFVVRRNLLNMNMQNL